MSLSCAICLGALRDPTTTSCGHNFCRACLARWISQRPRGVASPCPVCREPLRADAARLRVNLALAELLAAAGVKAEADVDAGADADADADADANADGGGSSLRAPLLLPPEPSDEAGDGDDADSGSSVASSGSGGSGGGGGGSGGSGGGDESEDGSHPREHGGATPLLLACLPCSRRPGHCSLDVCVCDNGGGLEASAACACALGAWRALLSLTLCTAVAGFWALLIICVSFDGALVPPSLARRPAVPIAGVFVVPPDAVLFALAGASLGADIVYALVFSAGARARAALGAWLRPVLLLAQPTLLLELAGLPVAAAFWSAALAGSDGVGSSPAAQLLCGLAWARVAALICACFAPDMCAGRRRRRRRRHGGRGRRRRGEEEEGAVEVEVEVEEGGEEGDGA